MKRVEPKDYVEAEVLGQLEKLEISQNKKTRTITTNYGGTEIATYTPTKIYQVVDFREVAKSFIKKISQHMTINNYYLKISGGLQELRLLGNEFKVGNDLYKEQAVIISSTDGTRTLGVLIGLWRQVCSNGAMAKAAGESFRVKHLKSNDEVIKVVNFEFGDLKKAFDVLKARISKLQGKTITLDQLRKGIIREDGKGTQKFLAFMSKLYNSKTDKVDYKTVPLTYKKVIRELASEAGRKRIEISPDILKMKTLNLKVDAYQAFQCYTEMTRGWDGLSIQAETDKFLEIAEAQVN